MSITSNVASMSMIQRLFSVINLFRSQQSFTSEIFYLEDKLNILICQINLPKQDRNIALQKFQNVSSVALRQLGQKHVFEKKKYSQKICICKGINFVRCKLKKKNIIS